MCIYTSAYIYLRVPAAFVYIRVLYGMACESCSVKFSFFMRKKQCMDCSRHFCSKCVMKRLDNMLSCHSCTVLSRRPLIRSQIMQMCAKDLRRYLLAKQVTTKGCIEKEDLIQLLLVFANGSSGYTNAENTESGRTRDVGSMPSTEPTNIRNDSTADSQNRAHGTGTTSINRDQVEEILGTNFTPSQRSEPIISEEGVDSKIPDILRPNEFKEVPVWSNFVKLSDINALSELEYLSVKQLKNLLSVNRVDYKGCVERAELLDRASRLWKHHDQSKADMETQNENLCKICWDEPIECVILECGHMACCLNCGKQMSECPICKQYIVRVVRIFKA